MPMHHKFRSRRTANLAKQEACDKGCMCEPCQRDRLGATRADHPEASEVIRRAAMSEKYIVHFDFDCEDEPPRQYVWDGEYDVMTIHEEPVLLADKWSWNGDDWGPSALACHVVKLLNAASEGDT